MDQILRLPVGLTQMNFRIYPVLMYRYEEGGKADWYESEQGQKSLTTVSQLIKQAAKTTPGSTVAISSTNLEPMPPLCQATANEVLEDIRRQKELSQGYEFV